MAGVSVRVRSLEITRQAHDAVDLASELDPHAEEPMVAPGVEGRAVAEGDRLRCPGLAERSAHLAVQHGDDEALKLPRGHGPVGHQRQRDGRQVGRLFEAQLHRSGVEPAVLDVRLERRANRRLSTGEQADRPEVREALPFGQP